MKYLDYAPQLAEPNVREIKSVEGPGGAGRSGEDTQEVQVPQPPWTENPAGRRMRGVKVMLRRIPLQVGEEGVWYYFCSSSSTTKDPPRTRAAPEMGKDSMTVHQREDSKGSRPHR